MGSKFINKIIHFSVYHRIPVLVVTFLIAVIGWFSYKNLSIDAVPDITNVQVVVTARVEGFAPEEIERSITYPVETAMAGIVGVTQTRSITRFGLSQVTLIFEDSVDIYLARQLVAERLQTLTEVLPHGVRPQMGPISTGLGEIYLYTIEVEKPVESGEKRDEQLMELRTLQEWTVKPRLLTVKGVAEVNTIGGYEKQYNIQPDIKKMSLYGLRFSDLKFALENSNKNVGGGYVQQTSEQFLVQAVGLLKEIEDIKAVPIKSMENLKTVTIGDVAEVKLSEGVRTGAALVRGKQAVVGTVLMATGENTRTVALRVGDRIREIQKSLPSGYKLEPLYDRSELVNATIGTVLHNLIFGAILVTVILLLLIGNIRAAVITAITIPLALLITFIGMKYFGISGNLMSLGALDFGIIVDGVVIVLDNCVRLIHERTQKAGRSLSGDQLQETIYEATLEIRQSAGFGQLIIVMIFLPIFGLSGIEGKMFTPMAAAFSFAIVGALVMSFTTAPALASLLLTGDSEDKKPKLMLLLESLYFKVLGRALQNKKITIMLGAITVIIGVVLFTRLGGEFLPQLDEGSIAFEVTRPANISIDQSIALEQKTEELVMEFPEVAVAFSRIGTAEIATDPMGVNSADTLVMFKDRSEWPLIDGKKRTSSELKLAIQKKLEAEIPGQATLMSQPIQMRFNEILEGTKADISVKVFGEDMKTLSDITSQIAKTIEEVPGAGDVELELKSTSPILKIVPKYGTLRKLGVGTQELMDTVGSALGGEEVGTLYEGVRRFPIVIRLNEVDRSDFKAIQNLPVGIGAYTAVPLSDVATVKFDEGYSSISREESKRRAAVMVNTRGRDTESFVLEAQKAVASKVKLPQGYYVEWGGNFKNLQEARTRLYILGPLTLLIVLLMIYAAFRSMPQTLLIFSGVPLALVGGVLGLLLNGLPFSISAGVGFIALSGIAVLNGVVLVNYFNDLSKSGVSDRELVVKGAMIRLRPVLMTALVDIFGFLPMMLSSGIGSEVQRPLASVVIGGVVSSTLLTLLVLPAAYSFLQIRRDKTT